MVFQSRGLLLAAWLVSTACLLIGTTTAGFSCLSNPCVYGICMDDLNSSYTCYCIDGYTGVHCQTNWDECWSSPCQNGGVCHDAVAAFNCTCPDGFTGEMCEENVDECSSNPCFNNGTCVDATNGYTCRCYPGYSGVFCEVDIAVCNSSEEQRCQNGGICIEGPGMMFSCICTAGWTGKLCDLPINECASSPCQNGAACIDLHAGYSCACLFGYTGHNCELEMSLCESNPCKNDALCLEEDDTSVCYCVPDYHGDRCQYQYDECQLGPGCKNGGTCIDGVDSYTCSCLPDLTGKYCECLILDDKDELDCSYVRPDVHTTTTTAELPTYSITTQLSTRHLHESTTTILPSLPSSQVPIMTETIEETSETISKTETMGWTEPTSEFQTTALTVTEKLHKTTSEEQRTTKEITETTLPTDTGLTLLPSTDLTTLLKSSTEITSVTIQEISTTEISTFSAETLLTTESTRLVDEHKPTELVSNEMSTETVETQTVTLFTMLTTVETTSEQTITYTEPNITLVSPTTEEIFLSTLPSPITSSPFITTILIPSETTLTILFPETTTVETETSTFILSTIPQEYITFNITEEETTSAITVSEAVTSVQETIPATYDCTVEPCSNEGTCYISKEGPKCMCKFGWTGVQCEIHTGVYDAAFTGHSYLIHRLSNTTGTVIGIRVRTLAPTGLLIYAHTVPHIFMAVYVQNGLLKFLFSCGIQTMLFSELHERINTGFHHHIVAIVEVAPSINEIHHCTASLKVNNSLTMSGEQKAMDVSPIDWNTHSPALFLGGLPKHLHHFVDIPVKNGITGCMQGLQIDGKDRSIYSSAVEGSEVTECSSLACLSSPCHSAATCVEHGENWSCLCPSGYVGQTCELSVCANNPCQYGGTCTEYPASGFICLCPFGKHGLFCQNDLEIGQPSYRPSVHGMSSYSAYTLPAAIHHSFEIRFRFTAYSLDQVALMLFIGQESSHDQTSDHLAVSFIKGYVVLTWNLGSGPRRIFIPKSVPGKAGRLHTVKLGRAGQQAWLQVDNFENITGSSPGKLTELNTKPVLFIGGHKAVNFSGLPHDLPLHTGFAGCIHGVELRAGRVSVSVGQVRTRAVVGRGVGQCGTSHCHNTTCLNGGACLDHGATFTCLCRDGWFGPVCALRHNPCDTNRHNCSGGATCVPLEIGYECDCPLLRAGKYCEKDEKLSDVYFSGHRSFMSLPTAELHLQQASLDFEVRPTRDRGLVLFSGQLNSQSFLSISLHGGVLELRLQTLGSRKRNGEVLVIRSGRILSLATWHRVRAGRYGRRFYLWVDGTVNAGTLWPGETLIPTDSPLYLGGIPDLSLLPSGAMAGLPVSFSGCMRRLVVNWKDTALDESKALSARNVADCDGTACGGDVCLHGGSCWLDTILKPHCTCPQEYTGDRCESLVSCMEVPCENGGHCIKEKDKQPKCHCPLGWSGPFCTQEVPKGAPHFGGDSYLIIDPGVSITKRRGINADISQKDIDFLYVNFSTAQPEGIILWTSMDNEFIGIGIENGLLKATWSWSGLESRTVIVPSIMVADGGWHDIAISFTADNITLWNDHDSVLTYDNPTHKPVTTDGTIYLGGFPSGLSVPVETKGLFTSQFEGCIGELAWSDQTTVTDFTQFDGENIDSCDFYEM